MVVTNNRRLKVQRKAVGTSPVQIFEPLEPRQLLSCVIDTRLAGGGKSISVTSVGQVVQMEVWAVITGKDATGANDGFESVPGSFLSTSASSTSVLGNLSATVLSPFTASGAQNGQQADLDGDGDLDIGSNDVNNFPPYFNARGPQIVTNGGVVSGASHSFEIGTLSFTVTNLKAGQSTNINFRERGDDSFTGGALWGEDGIFTDSTTGSFSVGAPVVITDSSIQTTTQSISGEVYKDTNSNGALNAGETGLGSVVVYLDTNNDGALDGTDPHTITDGNGLYSFTGINTGAYIVRQQVPSGLKQTAPSGGLGQHVSVTSGKNLTGINFGDAGSVVTGGQSVSGEVYNDANSNGALNAGESGVSSVVVYLDNNNDGVLDGADPHTMTDANGLYSFTGVPTGATIVRQQVPTGFKQTAPGGGLGQHITVSSGKNLTGINFGDASTTTVVGGSITGEVYKDTNGNAKLDSGETGLVGVVVYLDLNNNGLMDGSEPKTTTNSSGGYSFTNLAAGNYIVRQTTPSGFKQTAPTNNLGNHVSVANGKATTGANFGDHPTSTPAAVAAAMFSDSVIQPAAIGGDLAVLDWATN